MSAVARHAPALVAAFGEMSGAVTQPAAGQWTLALDGALVDARLMDDWLVLTMPAATDAAPAQLLRWNAALSGPAKFALAADDGIEVRAEIPCDDEEPIAPWLGAAWRDFETANTMLRSGNVVAPPVETTPGISPDELKQRCADAAWHCSPRDEGALAVELECPGAFHQALLRAHHGGVRASVALAGFPESASDTENAVAVLLLTASRVLRMARPAFTTSEGQVAPRFDAVFPAPLTAARVAHAFSALSVACHRCAEEAQALQNPDVAREFLALRASPHGGVRSVSNHRKENP